MLLNQLFFHPPMLFVLLLETSIVFLHLLPHIHAIAHEDAHKTINNSDRRTGTKQNHKSEPVNTSIAKNRTRVKSNPAEPVNFEPLFTFPDQRKQNQDMKPADVKATNRKDNDKNIKNDKSLTNNGPGDFVTHWPGLREKINTLQGEVEEEDTKFVKIEHSIKNLVEFGDKLEFEAKDHNTMDRLLSLSKDLESSEVKHLIEKYRKVDGDFRDLNETVTQLEEQIEEKNISGRSEEFQNELRKRKEFLDINDVLNSGYSALAASMVDTTDFATSPLQENRRRGYERIYKVGDGPGERKNLDDEVKDMQDSIDALSGVKVTQADPDLQKVSDMLTEFLTRNSRSIEHRKRRHNTENIDVMADHSEKDTFEKIKGILDKEYQTGEFLRDVHKTNRIKRSVLGRDNRSKRNVLGRDDRSKQSVLGRDDRSKRSVLGRGYNETNDIHKVNRIDHAAGVNQDNSYREGGSGPNEDILDTAKNEPKQRIKATKTDNEADLKKSKTYIEDLNQDGKTMKFDPATDSVGDIAAILEPAPDDNSGERQGVPEEEERARSYSGDEESYDKDTGKGGNRLYLDNGINKAYEFADEENNNEKRDMLLFDEPNYKDDKLGFTSNTIEDSFAKPLTVLNKVRDNIDRAIEPIEELSDGRIIDEEDIDRSAGHRSRFNVKKQTPRAERKESNSIPELPNIGQELDDDLDISLDNDIKINLDKDPDLEAARWANLDRSLSRSMNDDMNYITEDFPDKVGSINYWQKEIENLDAARKRDDELSKDLTNSITGKGNYSGSHRIANVLSESSRKIMDDFRGNSSALAQLYTLDPTAEIGDEFDDVRKFRESHPKQSLTKKMNDKIFKKIKRIHRNQTDRLQTIKEYADLGIGIDTSLRTQERILAGKGYAKTKHGGMQSWAEEDDSFVDLYDDVLGDTSRFEHMLELGDVEELADSGRLLDPEVRDALEGNPKAQETLKHLDKVENEVKETVKFIKKQRLDDLKRQIETIKNIKENITEERVKRKYDRHKAEAELVPVLTKNVEELAKMRNKQYEDMVEDLEQALKGRKTQSRVNWKLYKDLMRQLKRNKKVLNKTVTRDWSDRMSVVAKPFEIE